MLNWLVKQGNILWFQANGARYPLLWLHVGVLWLCACWFWKIWISHSKVVCGEWMQPNNVKNLFVRQMLLELRFRFVKIIERHYLKENLSSSRARVGKLLVKHNLIYLLLREGFLPSEERPFNDSFNPVVFCDDLQIFELLDSRVLLSYHFEVESLNILLLVPFYNLWAIDQLCFHNFKD